jgi:hypothetical protein
MADETAFLHFAASPFGSDSFPALSERAAYQISKTQGFVTWAGNGFSGEAAAKESLIR